MAKSVCLTRSASGRVPGPGARSRTPFADPAITRPASPISLRARRGLASPDAPQPAVLQLAEQRRRVRRKTPRWIEQPFRLVARSAGERNVLAILERGNAE